jgi:serine/threonine-protein kinase
VTGPVSSLVLGGRYELGPSIGSGGMAEVYRGVDVRLGRDVAVKVLRADLARNPSFQTRFRREAQAAASLNAPTIVSVFDTGEDDTGVPYIVMELLHGRTLRDVLLSEGRLLPQRACEVVADVCAALEVSHAAGIVHRDIKPANVMLTRDGDVKVMDFGIARAAADAASSVTQTATVLGTAAYLSPEQARGDQVDARSDLYSTGCVLYELLTGAPPFTGDSAVAVVYQHVGEDPPAPSAHDAGLSPALDAVVLKAMRKHPEHRYQSAAEMREDLLRAADGRAVRAAPVQEPHLVFEDGPVAVRVPRRGATAWKVLAYTAFGLLLLGLCLATALLVRGALDDGPRNVPAPALRGLSQEQALAELRDAGLTVGDVKQQYSDEPFGTVLAQSPEADLLLRAGGAVQLVLSRGVEMAVVPPEVVGLQRAEAEALLVERRLVLGEQVPRDGNVPAGTVLAVTPEPGTQVRAGTAVAVVVATGRVQVPDVRNRSAQEAAAELQRAGFSVGLQPRDDPGEPDRVLDQSPVGVLADRGSTVVVVVSRTPPPPPPPPAPLPLPPTGELPGEVPDQQPGELPGQVPGQLPGADTAGPVDAVPADAG